MGCLQHEASYHRFSSPLVPLTPLTGVKINSFPYDSKGRDRAGFKGHPDLIPS
jgi:hypothetical protein